HSSHYLNVLREADKNYYLGGANLNVGLDLFDLEFPNIEAAQRWASDNIESNTEAATNCLNYPYWGAHIIHLRLHPRKRVQWLNAALRAANQLKDSEAESRCWGDLGLAHFDLGEIRRAVELFNKSLDIERRMGNTRGQMHTYINLASA